MDGTEIALPPTPSDPTGDRATEQPIGVSGRPAASPPRLRWVLAAGGSLAVTLAAAVVAAMLVGGAGPSGLLARTPADSVAYLEVRFDLPGDQRERIGRFLAHFPGFDDRSLLEPKLADLFERAVAGVSEGRLHWSGGIDAWFGGQAALVLRRLPEPGAGHDLEPMPLLLATVTDPAAARTWATGALDALAVPWTRDSLAGLEVLRVGGGVEERAIAVDDEILVAGRLDDVRAVLETRPGASLAAKAPTKAALAALPADHLAWLSVDGVAYRDWLARVLAGSGAAVELVGLEAPDWLTAELRFDGDLAVVESVAPAGAAGPPSPSSWPIASRPTSSPSSASAASGRRSSSGSTPSEASPPSETPSSPSWPPSSASVASRPSSAGSTSSVSPSAWTASSPGPPSSPGPGTGRRPRPSPAASSTSPG
ncbi:MAG: hypothetical protein KatS3mg065_0510 [Chloroflexota bacterium]|nr:MAG: hypothetical protein KatS3mg065_0510 [Chloroflexota bacterium]